MPEIVYINGPSAWISSCQSGTSGSAVVGVACNATDSTQHGWAYDVAAFTVRQGALCLSTDGFGVPLNLYSCGNQSTHQNFSYDASTGLFHTMSPAPSRLYPGCLNLAGVAAPGELPVKVDVSRCEGTELHRTP